MAVQRRNTHQRALVLDAVLASSTHPTADEIFAAVRERDPKVSRGTVYRNLNLLADEGQILHIKTAGGSRFDKTVEPHAHVLCTRCGRVVDACVPYAAEADGQVARELPGWRIEGHYSIFEGVCPDCGAEA